MARTPKKQEEYQEARKAIIITKPLFKRFDNIRTILNRGLNPKDGKYLSRDALSEKVITEWVTNKESELKDIVIILKDADNKIASIMEKVNKIRIETDKKIASI